MATTKKNKPVSQAEFNDALAANYKAYTSEQTMLAKMEAELQKVREKYAAQLQAFAKTQEETLEIAQRYCETNETTLFIEKRSMATDYGTVGFKKSPASVVLCEGKSWEEVLKDLKKRLPDYVRIKEEVDKQAIIASREDAKLTTRLSGLGITIEQAEKFFFKPKADKKAAA